MNLREILQKYGKKYSDLLGIRLKTKKEEEVFKWFIASIFLGARISETLALRTYKIFESEELLSFKEMKKQTWDDLVRVLDAGGYVRYDFSTASNLMAILKLLEEKYEAKLTNIHNTASDPADLEKRFQEFKGIGPVTTNIFLRELRGIWKKADPDFGHLAKRAARELSIKDPVAFWKKNKVRGYDFVNFETALMRLGREARRKKTTARQLVKELS